MKSVKPQPGSIEGFFHSAPDDQPIVMINLLKYRERAQYPEGNAEPACSGREAYRRYQAQVVPMIKAVGAKTIWMGSVHSALIAPEGEAWEDAFLVQYPSKTSFVQMIMSPEYQKVVLHRMAALEDSRLIATVPQHP